MPQYLLRDREAQPVAVLGVVGGSLLAAYAQVRFACEPGESRPDGLEPGLGLASGLTLEPILGEMQSVETGEHELDVVGKLGLAAQLAKPFAWGEHPGRTVVIRDEASVPARVRVDSIDRALGLDFRGEELEAALAAEAEVLAAFAGLEA